MAIITNNQLPQRQQQVFRLKVYSAERSFFLPTFADDFLNYLLHLLTTSL